MANMHNNLNRDIAEMTELEVVEHVIGLALIQCSLKAGLKKFKEAGEAALKSELQQLHDMDVFIPLPKSNLTEDQKRKTLSTVTFIKQKHDGRVKGTVCVYGCKQCEEFNKEEAEPPTVTNESVFITGAINAKEGGDVATVDIAGAYLHAINDHEVHMLLEGKLAELMELVAQHIYQKHISMNKKGKPMPYVKLQKALYGLLKSVLLFYKKLSADLVKNVFIINRYDPCIANKQVNGAQHTVLWHVDNLKISHVETEAVTDFIAWLNTKYSSLTIHQGKKHYCLGMDLDYSVTGVLSISMTKYTHNIINNFPEELGTPSAAPAADHLFKVREPDESKKTKQ